MRLLAVGVVLFTVSACGGPGAAEPSADPTSADRPVAAEVDGTELDGVEIDFRRDPG
jgi:hypothetical protein